MRIALLREDAVLTGSLTSPIACFDEIDSSWSPLLGGEEDAIWSWREIVAECPHGSGWSQFELWADGRLQGLMVLKMRHDMRAAANSNTVGCYLEYMATAPWNRPSVIKRAPAGLSARVGGVGSLLLAHAIRCSQAEGLRGRLAWHSKSGAVDFYKHALQNAWYGGPDKSEQGLPYFELGEGEGFNLLQGTDSRFLDDES